MASPALQRRQLFYSGNVQGVGFRYTTATIARGFEVTGFVRNLPDRRVEVVVEGSTAEVAEFLAVVQERMSELIRDVQCDIRPAIDEFTGFEIRN